MCIQNQITHATSLEYYLAQKKSLNKYYLPSSTPLILLNIHEQRVYPLPSFVSSILPNTSIYNWNQSSELTVLYTALDTITKIWPLLKGSFNICSLGEKSWRKTEIKNLQLQAMFTKEFKKWGKRKLGMRHRRDSWKMTTVEQRVKCYPEKNVKW